MIDIDAPLAASLQITGRCNLNCKYCYSDPICKKDIKKKEVFRIIDELVDEGVFVFLLEGGEPFIHKDIIPIIKYLREYGVRLDITSNGTLINKRIAQELGKLQLNPGVQVSLDSHYVKINDAVRGKGALAKKGIKNLLDNNVEVIIGTVVHKKNINVADTIISYYYPKIKKFHYMNLIPSIRAFKQKNELWIPPDQLKNFWTKIRKESKSYPLISLSTPFEELNNFLIHEVIDCKSCTAGWVRITVTPDEKVLACSLARQSIIGDLSKNSLKDIWYSKAAEKIRDYRIPICMNNVKIS